MSPGAGSRPIVPLPQARRGLGKVFLVSGLLHAAIMVLMSLVAVGLLSVRLPQVEWIVICLGHLLLTVGLAGGFIMKKAREGDVFHQQLVIDLMAGLIVFLAVFAVLVVLLAFLLPAWCSWLSLASSGWLLYYGKNLYNGRQAWSSLDF